MYKDNRVSELIQAVSELIVISWAFARQPFFRTFAAFVFVAVLLKQSIRKSITLMNGMPSSCWHVLHKSSHKEMPSLSYLQINSGMIYMTEAIWIKKEITSDPDELSVTGLKYAFERWNSFQWDIFWLKDYNFSHSKLVSVLSSARYSQDRCNYWWMPLLTGIHL